ncbi:hypothetical protein KOI35_11990 [Actinoplanes bogorensis]|uniref:AAA+ ATPase domain-containing protein n=1 Tax=Paractinoplanes bogorensis TaxID=1610840 RepID=A0ABS5YL71_9ACTN|nr:hypothetical protein [Actinoplanes bogorensis]MBU2664213.1 hypothetical protein [Actinoplanes bogorensis]
MGREPPITFSGALKVLGHYERPLVDRLDRLLGGAILGAGVALAAGPAVSALTTLWSSVDQKNEAFGLLRQGLDRIEARMSSLRGYERVELVATAHTMLVISSLFEVLDPAKLTPLETETLATGHTRAEDESMVSALLTAEVPMPGAACGFMENLPGIRGWLRTLAERTLLFLGRPPEDAGPLADAATGRYQTGYLRMAVTVPDFMVWAVLGEHAATRSHITVSNDRMKSALDGNTAALSRVESMLAAMAAPDPAPSRQLEVLARANRQVLDEPVTRLTSELLTFPTVADGYINPSYRLAVADGSARPGDETWWARRPRHDDIDLMITSHLTSLNATRRPLLLLGHPGGGKSMLTKVLAARLPTGSYTVVRVSLRQVSANARIYHQIDQALDLVTGGRITSWSEVSGASAGTVRLVLLDGLDELLQATDHDRSGYLQDVADFQRSEAAQDRPVIVVVTSRTVVADRVEIPSSTLIAQLADFDDVQLDQWLHAWRRANDGGGPTVSEALAHEHLARQPLLLLMLAIYWAEPDRPAATMSLTLNDLYRHLLRSFAAREVDKRTRPVGMSRDHVIDEQVRRLSVAALGMFNRGRQDITDQELGLDLAGLSNEPNPSPEAAGQRILGEFFFVHAAEARLMETRRCYEFLHATFGEHLVASIVVRELAVVADGAFGGTYGPREPADDLLFALLSHQAIASRRPIVQFAAAMLHKLPEDEQERIRQTLTLLLTQYDRRGDRHRYPRYRPIAEDRLRELAAYSVNLVLLLAAADDEVSLDELGGLGRWRSIVTTWRAGLGTDGWQAVLGALVLSGTTVRLAGDLARLSAEHDDISYARLTGDRDSELRLRIGAAISDKLLYFFEGDDWGALMTSWLVAASTLPAHSQPGYLLVDPPPETPLTIVNDAMSMLSEVLISMAGQWSFDFLRLLIGWVDRVAGLSSLDPVALSAVVAAEPGLLEFFPAMADSRPLIVHALSDGSGMARHSAGKTLNRIAGSKHVLPTPVRPGYQILVSTWTVVVSFGSVTGSAPDGTDWDSPEGRITLS